MINAISNIKSPIKIISWLHVGAIILAFLAVISIYSSFAKNRKMKKQSHSIEKEYITFVGYCFYFLLVCAFLAGKVIPVIFPQSDFSVWMNSEYSLLIYLFFCSAIFTVFIVILDLIGFPISKKK